MGGAGSGRKPGLYYDLARQAYSCRPTTVTTAGSIDRGMRSASWRQRGPSEQPKSHGHRRRHGYGPNPIALGGRRASCHLGSSRPPPPISPHIWSDFDAIIAAPPLLPPCNAMLPPCNASRLSSDFIEEELGSTPPRTAPRATQLEEGVHAARFAHHPCY